MLATYYYLEVFFSQLTMFENFATKLLQFTGIMTLYINVHVIVHSQGTYAHAEYYVNVHEYQARAKVAWVCDYLA